MTPAMCSCCCGQRLQEDRLTSISIAEYHEPYRWPHATNPFVMARLIISEFREPYCWAHVVGFGTELALFVRIVTTTSPIEGGLVG